MITDRKLTYKTEKLIYLLGDSNLYFSVEVLIADMLTKLNVKKNYYIQTYTLQILPRVKFSNTKTYNSRQQGV